MCDCIALRRRKCFEVIHHVHGGVKNRDNKYDKFEVMLKIISYTYVANSVLERLL